MLKPLLIVVFSIGVMSFASAIAENEPAVDDTAVSADIEAGSGDISQDEAKWQPEDGDVIAYKVLRKGKKFGQHSVRFTKEGDVLTAVTDVKLEAGLGPIKIFTYTLNATEVWKNGVLQKVSGKLDDNGDEARVEAQRDGDVLKVEGTKFEGDAPGDIIPSSHWNFAQVQSSQLLSTEDGELLDIKVTDEGRETLTISGQDIETTRYLMDSDIDVELWYDDDGRWLKLAFEARGQAIEYVLTELY